MATIRRYGERTPQEAAAHVRRHRENLAETRRLQGTPGVIAATARALFERDGVRKTTVTAIAREANVTRELAYYHFGNKNGIIEAVLDDYAEDLVESVIAWNESRAFGDTAGSLRTCVHTFRYALYDADGEPRPMISVLEELGVRDAFDVPERSHRCGIRGVSSDRDTPGIRDVLLGDFRPGGAREGEADHLRRRPHEGGRAGAAAGHGARGAEGRRCAVERQ